MNTERKGEEVGVRAVILSAGQGKRLLPLTRSLPKCLLPVHGRTVLEWQLRSLREAGIRQVAIVVGFGAEQVEAEVARCRLPGFEVSTIHNALFDKSDNLVSCLVARSQMDGDFVLLNGDTLFQPAIVRRLLEMTGHTSVKRRATKAGGANRRRSGEGGVGPPGPSGVPFEDGWNVTAPPIHSRQKATAHPP